VHNLSIIHKVIMNVPLRKPTLLTRASLALVFSALASPFSSAANLYWDSNGAAAGAGATPTGTWGVDGFWNGNADGTGATSDYVSGSDVYFSAGSDAVDPYTVTLSGTQSVNGINVTSSGAVTLSGSGELRVGAGGVTTSGTLVNSTKTLLTANQTWDIDGTVDQSAVMSGTYGIVKTGTGTLEFSAGSANTQFSSLRISEGTVKVTGLGVLGLQNTITLDNVAGVVLDFTGAQNSKGFAALNGGGSIGGHIIAATSLSFYGGASTVGDYSGVISGAGGFSMQGAGKQILRGNSTFSGAVTVSRGGTLTFTSISDINGAASALGIARSISGRLNLGSANEATVNSTLQYIGTGHSSNRHIYLQGTTAGGIIDASGTGALVLSGSIVSSGAGTKTLTLTGTSTAANTISNIIPNNSETNVTHLKKTGSGTWVLGGANTYTGTTSIEAGTLLVNGSINAASAVSVSAGATLGGSGTVGAVTVGGILAPGNSIGTLNTGGLSFGAASSLAIELGRTDGIASSDRVNVTGGVSILDGASLSLTLSGGTPQAGDIFFLIINDGIDAIDGQFTQLNGVATSLIEGAVFEWNAIQWQVTYLADYGSGSFTGGNDLALLATIPEPGTWALLATSGVALALFRRRSQKVG
jgi:fibronectin-binding autotransporter adhesin